MYTGYLLSACTKVEENIPFTFTASLLKWVFGAGHKGKILIGTQLQHRLQCMQTPLQTSKVHTCLDVAE